MLSRSEKNGSALEFVREQTPEICLAAVQQYGWALKYVEEQTPEICLAAVHEDGYALKYVQRQTPEICLAAVSEDGYALHFVEIKTPELCSASIHQNKVAIRFIDEREEFLIENNFYGYSLFLHRSRYGNVVQHGPWYGNLEEFKVKSWEEFEKVSPNQTKEDVEAIIQKIEALL